jgi:hemerythrin superfamily protein
MGFVKDQMIEQMEEERENLELALDDIKAYGERYQCTSRSTAIPFPSH